MIRELEFSDFSDSLDIDAVEDALGFAPMSTKGNEDIGKCLDLWGMHKHGDQTGKFALNRDKLIYNCWVCGGGSLVTLVMDFLECGEDEAVQWLYQYSDEISEDVHAFEEGEEPIKLPRKSKRIKMPSFPVRTLDQFSTEYIEWYEERGIGEEIVEHWGIRSSERHKKMAPFQNNEKIDDDYFGPCIVFPHYWGKEYQLVGWQHRWLDPDRPDWLGKYTNTSDFPKETTMYNYDMARGWAGPVVLVESVTTCLFLLTLGYGSIASFGGKITPAQLKLLTAFPEVIIAPDNDEVGEEFTVKVHDYLYPREVPMRILEPVDRGEGADLGDYAEDEEPYEAVEEHINKRSYPVDGPSFFG